jgi:4-hydroxybenzoate polyprenyltransferase
LLAQVAAGDVTTSVRLAIGMLGLQVSIGALNDLVDAPRDATTKPGKPIPRGAASAGDARWIAGLGLGVAVALVAPSGPAALVVLGACAACGYGYDLRLSRTAISWLPLAVALPLVPVFAWVGATGSLPGDLLAIVPAGGLAGAGLALANALADLDRDRSTGARSAAVRLGQRATWVIQAVLVLGAVVVALVGRPAALTGGGLGRLVLGAGVLVLLVGVGLGGGSVDPGRRGEAQRRERAWELEAGGVALVAVGWLASLASG